MEQKCQLQTSYRIARSRKTSAFTHLSDADDEPLPDKFQNMFIWRGVYVLIENNHISSISETFINTIDRNDFQTRQRLPGRTFRI